MDAEISYEVAVVGGGPAGMTTALYTTRLGHRTAVFEAEGGRHAAVSGVHNLYGVSEDVSGSELSGHAVDQFEEVGGDYHLDEVHRIDRVGGEPPADGGTHGERGNGGQGDGGRDDAETDETGQGDDRDDRGGDPTFRLESDHATVAADRVVLATGFTDVGPDVPGLERFTGRGLHYCLHCDAATLADDRAFVLGHDEHAASIAMILLNFTHDVDLLLDGESPTWSEETERRLEAHPVDRVDVPVVGAYAREHGPDGSGSTDEVSPDDVSGDAPSAGTGWDGGADTAGVGGADESPWLGGLTFDDGTIRAYRGGFAMYGREYNADLAEDLGCTRTDGGAIEVDDDHRTSVDGVYAVGDVTHGDNQTSIALADGATAGMELHRDLRQFPLPVEDLDAVDDAPVPAAAPELRARMRLVRERDLHAGLREPSPRR